MPSGRWQRTLQRAGIAVFYLGIYATQGWKFSYERIVEKGFLEHGFLYRCGATAVRVFESVLTWPQRRVLFVQLAGFIARTKYYAVWSFA